MGGLENSGKKFGEIAVSLNYISEEQLSRALTVQARIVEKKQVHMPIGDVLIEMNVLSKADKIKILHIKNKMNRRSSSICISNRSKQTTSKKDKSNTEEASLDISVSKDKMNAFLEIFGDNPTSEFGLEDVKLMLQAEDILVGIAKDRQIEAYLNGEFNIGEPLVIAAGAPPIPASPPEIHYHFDTDPSKIGTLTDDGLMDWKDRGKLPQVKEGDLLAEFIPGYEGREGLDVHGNTVPIPRQKFKMFSCAKGVRKSSDGKKAHAAVSGMPKLSLLGEISVVPTLYIKGDISLETGHVDFDGHIEVAGTIEKGYQVKGASLRAKEILEAEIDIEGDITATNGIFGAVIRSEGNLKAGHLHNTEITIAGNVVVEKEIIDSTIYANGRCMIFDGIILSSTISAKMGIAAMDIGTQASNPSDLIVGIDQKLEKEYKTAKREIKYITQEQKTLPERIDTLKKQSDQLNTTLGEVAQKQDRCMVQQRRLQEKVETGMLNQGGAAAQKLQEKINDFKNRQEGFDRDVARLMEEDEAIEREIADIERKIEENESSIVDLKSRVAVIAEARKISKGTPAVKIGGHLCPGTRITGPNSFQIIDKDLSRLSIIETKRSDLNGIKQWFMEPCAFR